MPRIASVVWSLHDSNLALSTAALGASIALCLTGCSLGAHSSQGSAATTTSPAASVPLAASCETPSVQYTPSPDKSSGLSEIPWVRGEPRSSGLIALLWYWPRKWEKEQLRGARIFTGGVAPAGYNVKILWAFVAPSARGEGGRELIVRGQRLEGNETFTQRFARIGYAGERGPPSYASIIDVPRPGCWQLDLTTGQLSGSLRFLAIEVG